MKTHGHEVEVSGQSHAPAASPPGKEHSPHTHLIGDWVGPRDGLDTVVKREIPARN